MNRIITLLTFLLLLLGNGMVSIAQVNLTVNGSFENYNNCPNGLSDIAESYWDKAPYHTGSSDYNNACATSTQCDVPNNTFGSAFANTGDAYAGGYIGLSSGTYREYIFDTLSQALVSGSKYVVSFYYRMASNARYAGDDMGFYLSSTVPTGTGTGTLGVTPNSQNPSGNYLTNNTSWVQYIDTITASGGEIYITIGAFNANPATILYNSSASIGGAYYYWDDVEVHLLEGIDGDTNICLGDSGVVYTMMLDTVSWRDSLNPTVELSNQDTMTVSPTVTTTYMAVVPGDTYYFTVHVISPIYGFLGNDTTICEGETVTKALDLPGYSFLWSDNGTDSVLITQDSGEFWVEVSLHGCVSNDSFHIAYYPFPEYDLGPDQTICWYDSIELDPSVVGATTGYNWSNGSSDTTITVQNPGIYWVDISNVHCTMRDSIEISHHPTVVVDLGPDQEFCYSASELLTPNALNATSYTWSTGSSGPTATAINTGMYYVTATGNGCHAYDSVHYTFYYDPYFDLPETLMYCSYDTLTISSGLDTTDLSFVWNIGANTPTIDISGGSQGNYWLQVAGEHCTMRDTVYVGMYTPIDLELGEDIPLCEGGSVTITPNTDPTFSYAWSNGFNSFDINVDESGVYGLTVTDGNCTESDKVRVLIYQYPPIDLGEDLILCAPSDLEFDVTSEWAAVTFNWYDGTTTPLHIMHADEDQTIWVKATNFICSSYDTLNITMATPPVIQLINDTILCEEKYARVKAQGDASWDYTWSNGDTGPQMTTPSGGTYTVTVDDGTCKSVDSVIVFELRNPQIDILGPEYICIGEEEYLDATVEGGYMYRWYDGSNEATMKIKEPGVYSVEVSHDCGVARDTITVKDCECFVRFPSAFRPTPSGVNQTFGAVYECDLTSYKLMIFNRWGKVIFETENPEEQWDGIYSGKLAPTGAYGWYCEYKGLYDGNRISQKLNGTVLLLK